ncbi:MAG: hypothetical protein Q9161_009353 [Pseudevernia consocians]
MKEVLVYEGARTEVVESPIPSAEVGKVVIKVEVSGTNPKDWKTWWVPELPINMGDDIAGTIHEPWTATNVPTPLLIYGGSSAVGAFAIKLASASNLHPIIAVAGASIQYVSSLLDPTKGDAVVDYRLGYTGLQAGIRSALSNAGDFIHVMAALDTICERQSAELCVSFLEPQAKLAHVLPLANLQLLEGQTADMVRISTIHDSSGEKPGTRDFAHIMMQAFTRGLEVGWFKGHPYTHVPGGLYSVGKILGDLKSGKASATKYVFNICETEGI